MGESFLRLNGYQLEKDNEAAANIIIDLAGGEIGEVESVGFLDKYAHSL